MFFVDKLKRLNDKLNLLLVIQSKLEHIESRLKEIELASIQESLGRIESRQLDYNSSFNLSKHEYRVFSQWGEDGIIEFLLKQIKIENKIFVEFGVEDYTEANTRFLLTNRNWAGVVIDSSRDNIKRIKASKLYWMYNLKAVKAFITKDNINQILQDNGVTGEIGLLSIDIDGNDYWIWRAINVINPICVIIEYNYRFGFERAVTIPYDENFDRCKVHPSRIYFGASLKALCLLAKTKGYTFVGCNSNGVNAFFVRNDMKPDSIKEVSPESGYVAGNFREARDKNGELMYPEEEKLLLKSLDLPLVNVENIEENNVADIY